MAMSEVLVMATWIARTRDEPKVVCTTVHVPSLPEPQLENDALGKSVIPLAKWL